LGLRQVSGCTNRLGQLICNAKGKEDDQNVEEKPVKPMAAVTKDEEAWRGMMDKKDPLEEVGGSFDSVDVLGEPTRGNFRVKDGASPTWMRNVLGFEDAEGVLDMPLEDLEKKTSELMGIMGVTETFPGGNPARAVFCNRTLNLRSVKAIGYDMDYTLIHYNVKAWEGLSYEYGLEYLRNIGCPVEGLKFQPELAMRGLILDKEKGNLVKVDRFGFIKRAMHGTRMLNPREMHDTYGRELVRVSDASRWKFVNTLFSVSEAVMFAQLVDRLDSGALPVYVLDGQRSYQALYNLVAKAQIQTQVEGKLKERILENPHRFVELDPNTAATLLDQYNAGIQLVVITNSDLQYTEKLMEYAFNRYLPGKMVWQDLFDMVIVQARKPDFFTHRSVLEGSMYEVVTEDGLMRPVIQAHRGGIFCGGSAKQMEDALGVEGSDILYVGDHIYSDAALAKINLRWRTALIVRELEREVRALSLGRPHRAQLKDLLDKREKVLTVFNTLRIQRQRRFASERSIGEVSTMLDDEELVNEALGQLVLHIQALDREIAPMVESDGSNFNKRWGYLSRAGVNDKSLLQNQIEKHADIYTSRVSNFYECTPYHYFRSPMQTLPHDRNLTRYSQQVARWDAFEGSNSGSDNNASGNGKPPK